MKTYDEADVVETGETFANNIQHSRPTQHLPANHENLDYVKEFKKNIDLDIELNLEGQAKHAAKDLIDNDIDEILKGEPYEEVNLNDLERLFSIPSMRKQVSVWNFMHKYKYSMMAFVGFLVLSNSAWALSHSSVFNHDGIPQLLEVWSVLGVIALGCSAIVSLVHSFKFSHPDHVPAHSKIVVDLRMESVEKTEMKIPYGAKLRLKEAYDTGKFDEFQIAYPKPRVEQVPRPEPKIVDPAIIGVKKNKLTRTEKWYMIVFWDIPKDKEITQKKIKELKRFKLV